MKNFLIGFLFMFTLIGWNETQYGEEEKTNEIEEVVADGIGSTEEEARLAAIKECVRKVVGELVDAETVVKNQRVVEKILVASRANIEKHEILLREKDDDGIWTVKVKAIVTRSVLAERLKTSGLQVITFDGSNAAAKLAFEKGQDAKNVLFLAKYFRDNKFPYSLIEVTLDQNVQTVDKRDKSSSTAATSRKDDDTVVTFRFKVRPNIEKYNQFRDGLNVILDKLAVKKTPLSMSLMPIEQNSQNRNGRDRKNLEILGICPNAVMANGRYQPQPSQEENMLLLVFQSQSGRMKNCRWIAYELPPVFKEYFGKYSLVIPVVKVSVRDKNNKEITSKFLPLEMTSTIQNNYVYRTGTTSFLSLIFCQFDGPGLFGGYKSVGVKGFYNLFPSFNSGFIYSYIDNDNITSSIVAELNDYRNENYFLGPMTIFDHYVLPTLNLAVKFDMTMEELKKVGKTSIEVVSENPDMDRYYRVLERGKKQAAEESDSPYF